MGKTEWCKISKIRRLAHVTMWAYLGIFPLLQLRYNTMQNNVDSTVNAQVINTLNSAGIKFNIIAAGVGLNRDNWECDGWILKLHKNNNTHNFEYYTGIGHRKYPKGFIVDNTLNPRCIAYEQQNKNKKPVTPDICGIIHSLNLDSQAINESFSNWCDNFGYDSDSLKSLNVYNSCCETAKKYYSVVDRATREQLEVILQDY